jgi:hypothetical protein
MLISLIMALVVSAILYLVSNTGNGMYKWQLLVDLKDDVESIEFASPTVGWKADYVRSEKDFSRILKTEDGGKTWRVLYETDESIYKIRYVPEIQTIFALQNKRAKPKYIRSLRKSLDGGHSWKLVCLLSFPAQGVYFFNENNGYAWTSNDIYGTSNKGESWHKFAETKLDFMEDYAGKRIIGKDQFIYYIEDQKVFGFNFWKGVLINLPLPMGFEPVAVTAKPTDTKVAVLCKESSRWNLVEFENGQLLLTEPVPIREKEFRVRTFAYGDTVINLVGITSGSMFNSSHFYLRDKDGWQRESISGSNNYSAFAYCGDYAWAFRVALSRGTRELLFRDIVGEDKETVGNQ